MPTAERSAVGAAWIASSLKPALRRAVRKRADNRSDAVGAIAAAAQDDGVAGTERECAGVGGDVGTTLEDHADHADRRADALDHKAVGPRPLSHDGADGIGEGGDGLDASGDRLQALWREREAIDEALG